MYGSRGCTGRPGALDCQNCILPELMDPGLAAVAGGLIAVGPHQEDWIADGEKSEWDMLFDEAHARWYTLPHKLPQKRMAVRMVAGSAAMVASSD
jgi:hypothetical protein